MKYFKWAFQDEVGIDKKFEENKVSVCDKWDPNNPDWDKRGGFNFTNEECALRWMSRGDTLYEVEIPEDGEVLVVRNDKTPGGIIVANKIILKNPISISSELLMDFYDKSKLPLSTYFECVGLLAARGFYDVAVTIINDKVDENNFDLALDEFNNSIKPWHKVDFDCYDKVKSVLEEKKKENSFKR